MDSPQIIVNRKTEKVIDKERSVSEKIEQTQRTYLAGSSIPTCENEPVVITSTTTTTPNMSTTSKTSDSTETKAENGAAATTTGNTEVAVSNGNTGTTSGDGIPDNAQLISRTTQQVKTQQVKTVTKVFTTREIRHIGPDGQPIEANDQSVPPTTSTSSFNNNSDYTNFPGPKYEGQNQRLDENCATTQAPPQHSQANFDYQPQFDPHYSNTNFNLLPPHSSMAPSPSPGSGSTVTTGSTAVASFATPQMAQNVTRMYDPYARNNQIGYQDYSNFNNYQDMAHLPDLTVAGQGASPQPPIRRHHPGELASAGGTGGEPTYVQTSHGPVAYGYVQGQPTGTLPMHSPNPAASVIYGNFEEAPQGYLDRRQTYDDHSTYGQMRGPQINPSMGAPAMYDEAESAYQHLQALHAAGVMDPQQAAMLFQNGLIGPRMGPQSGAGAPGSTAVTAIGPDGVRWRDPDLHEVIEFLAHQNSVVRANAAAYLQHLCFMDDSMKAKTRALGGIPALVNLLAQDVPEIQRNACGALRNLSYGRQNDENKRAIRNAGGIPALVRLLRKVPDNEIREMVTSVLWNLSSCEELKRQIIDDALSVLATSVIIPHSGWDRQSPAQQQQQQSQQPPIYWSTLFRNASGVLRNVSSAGEYARRRLRECDGLVDSLLFLVRAAIGKNDMDNKSVENCVCVLRNLSYRCQEVVDPDYDKHPPGVTSPGSGSSTAAPASSTTSTSGYVGQSPSSTLSPSSSSSSKNSTSSLMGGLSSKMGDNLSCFGGSKKKSKHFSHSHNSPLNTLSPSASVSALEAKTANLSLNSSSGQRSEAPKGMELLWQTEVVQPYLALLSECSNPETLEAAAGAIQNLAACYWQPSIDIRGAVRKEKGLPILVELLRMEVDRVVCAVATALRNLAMDSRNKELIGKYALKDLVSKLPAPNAAGLPLETGTSDDTIAAVLATLNEVVARNPDFAKSLLEAGGMQRLTLITKHRNRFSTRVVKFTSQLLYNMWQHTELREVYRKAGWKEPHFLVQLGPTPARQGRPNGSGMMTPSASAMMMTPNTPTANGGLPGSTGLYHSISANNTLSRPMSTVGGTKYEDHQQFRTMPRPQSQQPQMLQARMPEELLMSDMVDGSVTNGTLIRQPMVTVFRPKPGEPVYAQVNRERKRQQQTQPMPTHPPQQVNSESGSQEGSTGNYHNVMLDPSNNEPIYPATMPAGDSWV